MKQRARIAQRLAILSLLAALTAVSVHPVPAFAERTPRLRAEPIKPDALKPEDPFEGVNRVFYAIHRTLDRAVLRPLAMVYKTIIPGPIRGAAHNVITETSEPWVFINDVLQLRPKAAGRTLGRFTVNAVVGVGGILDPATKMGLPHTHNGFGMTLGRYGVTEGPYLFLPFFGPSNFRDLIGLGVDFYADPIGWGSYDGDSAVRGSVWVVGGLDERVEADPDLQRIEQMGTDTYATMRSLYLQNRRADIRGGEQVKIEDLPDFEDTPAPPPAEAAPAATDQARPSAAVRPAHYGGPDAMAFLTPPDPRPAPAPAGPAIEL